MREARAASALSHPNIVTVHSIERLDDRRFIVMEYVEGDTLRSRIDAGRMSPADALELGIQVAGALAGAHDAGVIHRDIKPANIVITPTGQAKVLDFGIAKRWDDPPTPELIHGTVGYMSPDQTRGEPLDRRTDVLLAPSSRSGDRCRPSRARLTATHAIARIVPPPRARDDLRRPSTRRQRRWPGDPGPVSTAAIWQARCARCGRGRHQVEANQRRGRGYGGPAGAGCRGGLP